MKAARIDGRAKRDGAGFHLAYTRPYEFDRLLGFFRARQLEGVEVVDGTSYTRAVRIERDALDDHAASAGDAIPPQRNDLDARRDSASRLREGAGNAPAPQHKNGQGDEDSVDALRRNAQDRAPLIGWVRVENDAAHGRLSVHMSESLLPAASVVTARVRHQFDANCDPSAVAASIASLDRLVPGAAVPGTRVPGAFDPFETAVRAVLGQQVSVQAANKLAARIAQAYGTPVDVGVEGLRFLFPTARDFLAMDPIEDALGKLGVIKTRSRTIRELARLTTEGALDLNPTADAKEQMDMLLSVKGIGPWSANYIAMRTLGYTDAFLESDAGVKHALPDLTPKERLAAAEEWRPWRAYANLCLWNSLA